jgi:hypothetical protein
MTHECLSDKIDELWRKFMNAYAQNTGGYFMDVPSCQYACEQLWEMREAALDLERSVPPKPPEAKGENVVIFSEYTLKNTQKRRN